MYFCFGTIINFGGGLVYLAGQYALSKRGTPNTEWNMFLGAVILGKEFLELMFEN